jgi:hypothetical protein
VADVVGQERAGRAAHIPVRVEHEVVDQQLAPLLEQLRQGGHAAAALEQVRLADLGHRQAAPLSVQRVALAGELLSLASSRLRAASHSPRGTIGGSAIPSSVAWLFPDRCQLTPGAVAASTWRPRRAAPPRTRSLRACPGGRCQHRLKPRCHGCLADDHDGTPQRNPSQDPQRGGGNSHAAMADCVAKHGRIRPAVEADRAGAAAEGGQRVGVQAKRKN